MAYIEIPLETDPVDVADEAFAYLEDQVAGWLPSPGNLEAWLVEALAQQAGELRTLAALVPEQIFAYYGTTVLGLPPYEAVPAEATTTWTMVNNAGYTVNAGTLVGLTPAGEQDVIAFEVVEDFTVAAGQTQAAAIDVRALEAGADANGLTGTMEMLDQLDFVATVALNVPTAGGADEEEFSDYLDRLSNLMTLLAPRPILPNDFAVMVQQAFPQVGRATSIDLYKGDTGTPNTPRCTTVVVADANGEALSGPVMTSIDDYLEARREVNFLVYVIAPTYTQIDVTFAVVCYPGYVPADVQALVIANLSAWLSPANWGMPPFGDPGTQSWLNETKVRYLEVAEQVNRTDGVNYISTLQIGIHSAAMGTADLTLTGVAPLPRPGTIAGTAT